MKSSTDGGAKYRRALKKSLTGGKFDDQKVDTKGVLDYRKLDPTINVVNKRGSAAQRRAANLKRQHVPYRRA